MFLSTHNSRFVYVLFHLLLGSEAVSYGYFLWLWLKGQSQCHQKAGTATKKEGGVPRVGVDSNILKRGTSDVVVEWENTRGI